MSEPFIGQIVMFAGNFAPRGWAFCDGQLLAISQNSALFSILGTTYGGDGRTTFGLPDLRGRFPMHPGSGPGLTTRSLGAKDGAESVTLTLNQMPSHDHPVGATTAAGTSRSPAGKIPAAEATGVTATYGDPGGPVAEQTTMAPTGRQGADQPHDNIPPFNCVNFIIALQGIFPSRN